MTSILCRLGYSDRRAATVLRPSAQALQFSNRVGSVSHSGACAPRIFRSGSCSASNCLRYSLAEWLSLPKAAGACDRRVCSCSAEIRAAVFCPYGNCGAVRREAHKIIRLQNAVRTCLPRGTYSDISAGRTRRRCGTEMTRYCFPKAPSEEGRSVSEYPMRPHERPSGARTVGAGSEAGLDDVNPGKRGNP